MKLVKNSFFKASLIYVLITVVNGIITILTTTLIVNNLSTGSVGEIDFLMSVSNFGVMFIHFGSSTFIAQKDSITNHKKTVVNSNAISLFIFNSLLVIIFSLVALIKFSLIEYFFIVSYSVLLALVALYLSYLQLNNFKKKFAIITFSLVSINYITLLIFKSVTDFYELRLFSLIFVYFLISISIVFHNKIKLKKYIPLISFKVYKQGYDRGKILSVGSFLSLLTEKFDRLFVYTFMGSSSAGLYGTMYQFGSLMLVLQNSISRAWIPYIKELENQKNKVKKAVFFTSLFYIIVSIIIATLAVIYVFNFLPNEYHDYWLIIYIISVSYAIDGILKLLNGIFILNEQYNLYTRLNIISAITNIILVIIFYPLIGLYGIALSTFFSFLFPLLYIHKSNHYEK